MHYNNIFLPETDCKIQVYDHMDLCRSESRGDLLHLYYNL
jgi:hypothetical protein